MVRIASNEATAQSAVSSISNLTMPRGRTINLSQSTIPSMKTGCEVSNQLLANLENWSKRCKRKPTNFLNLLK